MKITKLFAPGLILFSIAVFSACAQSSNIKLVKQWETDSTIRTPESVLWDPSTRLFFVSDITGGSADKDGNGFISQIDKDGKILKLHWVDGLDAPKGLGIYNGELYAADIDQLVIINIGTGVITKKIPVPGASFLNDITVDNNGTVYISDSRSNKIYKYEKGEVSLLTDAPEAQGVNGLLAWHGKLWFLAADGIFQYDFSSKKISLFSNQVKGGDGLTAVNNKDLIASRWQGEVFYVKSDGNAKKILDLQAEHRNTADVYYYTDDDMLMVPTFNGNVVAAYKLER